MISCIKALLGSQSEEAMCKEYALVPRLSESLKCMISENGSKVFGMMLKKKIQKNKQQKKTLEPKVFNKAAEGKKVSIIIANRPYRFIHHCNTTLTRFATGIEDRIPLICLAFEAALINYGFQQTNQNLHLISSFLV